jgi:hypothetical protein
LLENSLEDAARRFVARERLPHLRAINGIERVPEVGLQRDDVCVFGGGICELSACELRCALRAARLLHAELDAREQGREGILHEAHAVVAGAADEHLTHCHRPYTAVLLRQRYQHAGEQPLLQFAIEGADADVADEQLYANLPFLRRALPHCQQVRARPS